VIPGKGAVWPPVLRQSIDGHLRFVEVVYDVIEAQSAASGGRSSGIRFLLRISRASHSE
jgi:hypothetical protein